MFVLVLAGPTAVGKSDLALGLAQELGGEILTADSMQVYKLMDIGTAKPSAEERSLVPHHLLDLIYPDTPFSVAQYAEEFHRTVAAMAGRGGLPIVAGGTGLYIRAAIRPFLFPEAGRQAGLRESLQAEAEIVGPAGLHAALAKVDAPAAARIHPHDTRRVIRALEVYRATGKPISVLQRESGQDSPYKPIYVCLTRDREELYQRIDARAGQMLQAGFLAEVRDLLAAGYGSHLPPMQGLGYRELASHLTGKSSLPDAMDRLKQRTRNYAKRQLTWFRHEPDVNWLNLSLLTREKAKEEILRLWAGRWKSSSNN